MLEHPSICAQGQVIKSSKEKLGNEMPVPSFLVYPSHQVKVFAKHIFSIVSNGKAHRFGCTKSDALGIKKDRGYMIKSNRNKSVEQLQHSIKVPHENMFSNHVKFSAERCFKKKSSEEGK